MLIVAPTVLIYGFRLLFHAVDPHSYGLAGNPGIFSQLSNLMAEFGFIGAAALGAAAGTTDLTDGMFRHLVITGRSRLALYLARIPAGLAITIPLVALGFAMNCLVTSYESPPPPTSVALYGLTVPEHLDQAGLQTLLLAHPQQAASNLPLPTGPGATPAQVRSAIDKNIATFYSTYTTDEIAGSNPADNEMAKIGLWLELEVGIGFLVGLGLGSLTGQRTTTTIVLIGLEIIVTPLLARVQIPYFIDGQRLDVGVAMDQLRPAALASGAPGGGGARPAAVRRARSSRHPAHADLGDDLGDRRLDRRLVGDRRLADDDPGRLTERGQGRPVPAAGPALAAGTGRPCLTSGAGGRCRGAAQTRAMGHDAPRRAEPVGDDVVSRAGAYGHRMSGSSGSAVSGSWLAGDIAAFALEVARVRSDVVARWRACSG